MIEIDLGNIETEASVLKFFFEDYECIVEEDWVPVFHPIVMLEQVIKEITDFSRSFLGISIMWSEGLILLDKNGYDGFKR